LDQLEIRKARLLAERDNAGRIVLAPEIITRAGKAEVAQTIASEQALFELRLETREGQKAQLGERLTQIADEVTGLTEQRNAKQREIALVEKELIGIRKLWESRIIAIDRLTVLERDAARLKGEVAQLTTSIAQAKGRASEVKLQIHQIDHELRSGVAAELREVESKIAELIERKIAAQDQLQRVDVRSPQEGAVHELVVHTEGGVVAAGEALMYIVPLADRLSIDARILPHEIDQLTPGQGVVIRLSAFNQRITPELAGSLATLSADLTFDQRTGESFFKARVVLPLEEIGRLKGLTLTAGMPVEVFFPTRSRTILSYLLKPVTDQMLRVFRED
jgi:HlyD family secretion protein